MQSTQHAGNEETLTREITSSLQVEPALLVAQILSLIFVLALVGLWVWSLIHCIRNKKLNKSNRIIGIVLILLLSLLGSLIYLFIPREDSIQKTN